MRQHIDLEHELIDLQIYGGESEFEDAPDPYYGINIFNKDINISIDLSPKIALDLYNKLGEHLKLNGRIK